MRVGIIGAGAIGGTLARFLANLGHQVSIANSSGPESLAAFAAEIGATPVSVADAAGGGEVVIISIPTKAVADLPRELFANVPDSVVVIDTGNYHPELRDGRIDAIDRGMLDSQWVAKQIGRPVIKAFNNIYAKSLLEKGVPRGTTGRVALSVMGDSLDAKATVLRLVDDLGFDPVDGGDLDASWRQQTGSPAYCQDLDAAALRRALGEADRSRIAECRAEQEARISRYIAAQQQEAERASRRERTTDHRTGTSPELALLGDDGVEPHYLSGLSLGRAVQVVAQRHFAPAVRRRSLIILTGTILASETQEGVWSRPCRSLPGVALCMDQPFAADPFYCWRQAWPWPARCRVSRRRTCPALRAKQPSPRALAAAAASRRAALARCPRRVTTEAAISTAACVASP